MQIANQRSNNSIFWLLGVTSTFSIALSLNLLWRLRRLHDEVRSIKQRTSNWPQENGEHYAQRKKPVDVVDVDQVLANKRKSLARSDESENAEASVEAYQEGTLPLRFLRAGKNDEAEGYRRYMKTLQWRKDNNMDQCLFEAWPKFELIKSHYPHYLHGRGRNNEPVFFEQPPKTDLKALREGGVDLDYLLRHYAMICEFQWQYIDRDDFQKSIYIIDLDGIRMGDFVGECKEYVQRASEFTAQHYPERAGTVFVINVPYWFKMIWNIVSKWVDEVTLKKIFILRGEEEIYNALVEKVPEDQIPQEYGGRSPYKLGESPEEQMLWDLIKHNNEMIIEGRPCCNANKSEPCRFCNFQYARYY